MGSLNKAAQTQLPQLVLIGEVLTNGQADFRVIPARSRLLKARTYPSTAVTQSSVLAVISRTKNTGTKDPQRNGARSRLSERTAAGHSREEEDDEEVRAAPIRREPPRGEGKEPPLAHGQRCAAPQVNAAPGGSAPPRIAPHRSAPRHGRPQRLRGAHAAQRKAKQRRDGTRMGDRREDVDGSAIFVIRS